jgi:hypothetical protein
MPMYVYKCNKCGSGEAVEREKPPIFCQNCGTALGSNIFEAHECRENKPPRETKTPPQEPKEPEETEEPEPAEKAPPKKKSCKYGSVPPTKEKCQKCQEPDCTDRVARCKYHWKRRKAVKILKSVLGSEIVEIITDKEVIKDVAKSRAKKLIEGLGIKDDERDEMLRDLEGLIDRGHEKLKKKLK